MISINPTKYNPHFMAITIEQLRQYKYDSHLDLRYKRIESSDIPLILEFLKTNKEIISLNIRFNALDDKSAKALAGNSTLTKLNLKAQKFWQAIKN